MPAFSGHREDRAGEAGRRDIPMIRPDRSVTRGEPLFDHGRLRAERRWNAKDSRKFDPMTTTSRKHRSGLGAIVCIPMTAALPPWQRHLPIGTLDKEITRWTRST
jgi:hypothetical protein